MKFVLEMLLFWYDEPALYTAKASDDLRPEEIVLTKTLELPFIPQPGMQLILPCIAAEHPDASKLTELISRLAELMERLSESTGRVYHWPESATGKVHIGGVIFDVGKQEFLLSIHSDMPAITFEAVDLYAQQLIIGYGFERKR